MKWDQIETQWKEFAVSARAHWSKLTDDDAIGSTKAHLNARIQKRYAITREEAEKQLDAWSDGLIDVVAVSRSH